MSLQLIKRIDIYEEKPNKKVVRPKRKMGKVYWSHEDEKKALFLSKQGITHKQIAKQLGRTESSIYMKLKRLRGQVI
jgi:DNA-binding CsgD family transcriptional regulator